MNFGIMNFMKKGFLKSFCLLFGAILLFVNCFSTQKTAAKNNGKRLVWSDEFDYTGQPDTAKWGYDLGDGCAAPSGCGWGNNERQFYTDRRENARVENGQLIVEARREKMGSREYTSTRMVTKRRGDWTFGRIEVRAKLPHGVGVWPAIWMLPSHSKYGGWPMSGEIDIMENVGYMPDSVFGTVHTDRFNGMKGTQISKGILSKTLADEFHVYGIDWDADKIDFLFDGQPFHTFKNRHDGLDAWPFDRAFHLILDLAVGGNWGGKMGVDEAIWPQKMLVDWVRVYQ